LPDATLQRRVDIAHERRVETDAGHQQEVALSGLPD
jgi:hypothetical protein